MTEVSTRPSDGATKHRAPEPALAPLEQLSGFSQQQCELAFNTISAQAEVLRNYLADALDRFGRDEAQNAAARDFRLALQLTALIGATADHMGGCTHLGSVADWACGSDMWPKEAA